MADAWWDRGERGTVTRRQIAVRAAAAFVGIALTMSIWWPAGIAVALIVCVAATVVAKRMIEAGDDSAADGGTDLATLLGITRDADPA
ncbi:MAG: hypothetical protein ACTHJL_00525 [Amnibacterium sp.]